MKGSRQYSPFNRECLAIRPLPRCFPYGGNVICLRDAIVSEKERSRDEILRDCAKVWRISSRLQTGTGDWEDRLRTWQFAKLAGSEAGLEINP